MSSDGSFHSLPYGITSLSRLLATPEEPLSSDGNANDDIDEEQSGSSDDEEDEVESIVGAGYDSEDELMYEVHWKGWPSSTNTWELASSLERCSSAIREFNRTHPELEYL